MYFVTRQRGVLFLVLAVLFVGELARGERPGERFTELIGCKLHRGLCLPTETCMDDCLFGQCQSKSKVYISYCYQLDPEQQKELRTILEALLIDGAHWTDLTTQCVIGTLMLTYRSGVRINPSVCVPSPEPGYGTGLLGGSRHTNSQSLFSRAEIGSSYGNGLGNYGDPGGYYGNQGGYYGDSGGGYGNQPGYYDDDDGGYYGNADGLLGGGLLSDGSENFYPTKRTSPQDQFVQVHKYWAHRKRDYPLPGNAFYPLGRDSSLNNPQYPDYDPDQVIETDEVFLNGPPLSPQEEGKVSEEWGGAEVGGDYAGGRASDESGASDDIMSYSQILAILLQRNGKTLFQDQDISQDYYQPEVDRTSDMHQYEPTQELPAPDNSLEYQYGDEYWNNGQPLADIPAPDILEVPESDELLSSDPAVLEDLIQGKISAEDLDEETANRLYNYVDNMLQIIKGWKQEGQGDDEVVAEKREDNGDFTPKEKDQSFSKPSKEEKIQKKFDVVDANYGYFQVDIKNLTRPAAKDLLHNVESVLKLPPNTLDKSVSVPEKDKVSFYIDADAGKNAGHVAKEALKHADEIKQRTGYTIIDAGEGDGESHISIEDMDGGPKYYLLTFVLCGAVAGTVLAVIGIFIMRRHSLAKRKLKAMAARDGEEGATKDYQDLCRQRMQTKTGSEKSEPVHVSRVGQQGGVKKSPHSSHSSTSSWSEEPAPNNMDITTGHVVLAYMEDHLHNKDRLAQEWEGLCSYEADPCETTSAQDPGNQRKNRYSDVLPYDHSRVVLTSASNVNQSDYINASSITDHDPRNPAYIATQGPLPHTVADFWQMVWEQGSVVIVNLTKLTEDVQAKCHRYWPEEGSELYHTFEIHLVSEHIWCEDYVVRSFYLKNLQTGETRTVSQFHFLTWPDLGIPGSCKPLLEFRRKVNKSYKGRSCPVVVHCSDGAGRSGTYCLIDMVLNRLSKGAKELDIAATLEHIRDQRMQMVKTKEQFEFALASVAEEVTAILKSLSQT